MTLPLRPGDYRLLQDQPAEEPVTLSAAKAHLRLAGSAEDDAVAQCVAAARQLCEEYTGKVTIGRSVKIMLDRWPQHRDPAWWDGVREGAALPQVCFSLPTGPVQTLEGIYVYDSGGTAQPVEPSIYAADMTAGRIAFRATPPEPGLAFNGIEIRLTAGYGAAASVPAPLRQAVLQLTAYLYSNRGDDASPDCLKASGALALLAPYRGAGLR